MSYMSPEKPDGSARSRVMDRDVTIVLSEISDSDAVAWPATEAPHRQAIEGLLLVTENSAEEIGVDRGRLAWGLPPCARGWRQRFAGGSSAASSTHRR